MSTIDQSPASKAPRFHLASLLDLSSRITEANPIDIMNVAVLSIMGRLKIVRACVLIHQGDVYETEMRLSKGVQRFTTPWFETDGITNVDGGNVHHAELVEHGLQLIVPLSTATETIGVLCLGPMLIEPVDSEGVTTYLELARTIVGTAVHNAQMVSSLIEAKKELEARTLMVTTLFESARDFTGAKTKEELLKILSYRLMGQLMVSEFALFLDDPLKDDDLVIVNRRSAESLVGIHKAVQDVSVPMIVADLPDSFEHRDLFDEHGVGMIAPMTVHGIRKGVVATKAKLNARPFLPEELSFLEAIGNTAMTAIENGRLLEQERIKQRLENELSIAADIQRGLLPLELPNIDGFDLAAYSRASRAIGGDYYEVIRLDEERTLIAIADVAGKGIPAALLMANVQSALNVLAKEDLPLTKLAERINLLVCENTEPEVFITMFMAVVNAHTFGIEYVNAGHNPPILVQENGVELLKEGGVLTGVIPDPPPYTMGIGTLKSGDVLMLYTDGVTEARNSTGEYGLPALINAVRAVRLKGAQEIVEHVQQNIEAFTGELEVLEDDTSMLVLKVL